MVCFTPETLQRCLNCSKQPPLVSCLFSTQGFTFPYRDNLVSVLLRTCAFSEPCSSLLIRYESFSHLFHPFNCGFWSRNGPFGAHLSRFICKTIDFRSIFQLVKSIGALCCYQSIELIKTHRMVVFPAWLDNMRPIYRKLLVTKIDFRSISWSI